MRETIETTEGIYGFYGKYRPLSNFDTTPFTYGGFTFKSSEHAFHFYKTYGSWSREILKADTPSLAKQLGRKCPMRKDWDDVKIGIMEEILFAKFNQNQHLKDLLMSTGDKYLEETNDWNDTYWGVCNGKGNNHLGKILMNIRGKIRIVDVYAKSVI